MIKEQLERIKYGAGFIAALDQSGGSTPKALRDYGIETSEYHTEDEMYDLIQQMRSRVIASKAFSSKHILGTILFEKTMERKIDNLYTSDYLWEKKGIVPFLKIDNGLDEEKDGVQLMKPIPKLDELLNRATAKNIFGTKMRSVIHEANGDGIHAIVEQQFELGKKISDAGFVPILEPEVDIHSNSKQEAEEMLIAEMISHLKKLDDSMNIMLKVSIPSVAGTYNGLMNDPRVVRIVALSGGYSRKEANELLRKNPKLIASFSRALLSDLSVKQTQKEFDAVLLKTIIEIYEASL
ncbi:fructose bisphosphate aldolase [Anaerocolumna sp. MB42-C2]|uniref:fructose bisphosphate aldolase n=1 Tax=Anaerocolumna sp. MB42-C2 TaxID=3070997 RepID=UPI0027E0FBED|nr:fructose bisphosphate aldolase [Anaerocolumna sp. MB42-C2]WMJ88544.1 fructose bisphosphate aldolase [Anaerocolumna sp. MB42-C2]